MGIEKICDTIKKVIDKSMRPKVPSIAPILRACSYAQRPGLSVIYSVGKIIQNLSKSGISTEDGVDGRPNYTNKLVTSVVSEIYRAIKEDMCIQVSVSPGGIQMTGTGANAGGPVQIMGFNTNCPDIKGGAL